MTSKPLGRSINASAAFEILGIGGTVGLGVIAGRCLVVIWLGIFLTHVAIAPGCVCG